VPGVSGGVIGREVKEGFECGVTGGETDKFRSGDGLGFDEDDKDVVDGDVN